jgi:hypothetical protein
MRHRGHEDEPDSTSRVQNRYTSENQPDAKPNEIFVKSIGDLERERKPPQPVEKYIF